MHLYRDWLTTTVWELGWAALVVSLPMAEAAAGDQPLQDLLPAKLERRSHPQAVVVEAALSRSACAGTSGHAEPPYKQMMLQSRPFASGLPVAGGHKRPCLSGACACHIPRDLE